MRFKEHTTGSNAEITRSLRTPLAPLRRRICCSNCVMSHMQYYEVLHGSSAGAGTAGVGVSMVVVCVAVVGIGSCWALLGVLLRCTFKRITRIERRLLLVCASENGCLIFECSLVARTERAGTAVRFGVKWFNHLSNYEMQQQQHRCQLHSA